MPSGIWSDANVLKFIICLVYTAGSPTTAQFKTVAERLGPEFTVRALASKWARIKAQADKEGGSSIKKGGKGAKAAEDGEEGNEANPKGRKRKADTGAATKGRKKAKSDSKATSEDEGEDGINGAKAEIMEET